MNEISLSLLNEEDILLKYIGNPEILKKRAIKKKLISFDKVSDDKYILRNPKSYEIEDLINHLKSFCNANNLNCLLGQDVLKKMNQGILNIVEKQLIGENIKKYSQLEKEEFLEFSKVLKSEMERELFDMQLLAAYHAYKVKRNMNFSVPGSGKTSMVYGLFAFLNSKYSNEVVNRIVVICPKNAFKAWKDEFILNFGSKKKIKLLSIDDKVNFEYELVYNLKSYNLILINYEKMKSIGPFMNKLNTESLFVFDEIHRIKNPSGVYAINVIERIKTTGHMCALTGTPMPNGYMDLINMLKVLFRDEFDIMDFGKFDFKNLTQDEKKIINKAVNPFFTRITKNELNVPKINSDIVINVPLNNDEKKAVEIVLNKNYSALLKSIRLTQVLSVPQKVNNTISKSDILYDEKIYDEIINSKFTEFELSQINKIEKSSKMKKIIFLIKDLVKQEKKILVWCQYIDSISEIREHLIKIKINVKIITGVIPNSERELIIDEFNNGFFDVLISNPQTLAESVSLHKICHDAIYFELNYDLAKFLQSKDRIHRIGLGINQYTQYYFFNCEITDGCYYEEKILDRLKYKEAEMIKFLESDSYVHTEDKTGSKQALINIFREIRQEKNASRKGTY